MKDLLENIKQDVTEEIEKVSALAEIKDFKVRYLGKKGKVTQLMKNLNTVSEQERPAFGKAVNDVRNFVEGVIADKESSLKNEILQQKLRSETIDVTVSMNRSKPGKLHPLTVVIREVEDIFLGMGFEITAGPEIENVYYNFDALNAPLSHPSRSKSDTFYIKEDIVLRTQTSSVQIREMEKKRPPIKIISPGRVYRLDDVDATHSPMFHQIEGLVIDKNISMGDLKWTLDTFIKKFYGEDVKTRFRPHHFPFTEPSAEVDMTCFACKGKGCKVCKGEGYIEILGAGLVHPNVLRNCGIDPKEYSGFAFGVGLDRLAMLKFNIDDLRLMYSNDIRFLSQG